MTAEPPTGVVAPFLAEPLVSVVVPVLDEARALPAALDRLAALPGCYEVLVADGGSSDGTPELARDHPLRPSVIAAPRGRAAQMNAAAAHACGEILVFLHADTALPASAYGSLSAALRDPGLLGGDFALRFDGHDGFSRVLGAWRAAERCLGVYYGDSAIWLRRSAFASLGGYRELAIMEDYELVRRLERRGRTACLPGPVVTSSRRWRAFGIPRTVASWVLIRGLFVAGVPARRLAALYPGAR